MKRVLYLLPAILILLLTSCMQEVGDITPSNLDIEAYQGTQVRLTWEAPASEVDGYILEFVDEEGLVRLTDTIAPTIYSYTHDPQGYVGTYKLYGYKGDSVSSPVTVSTIPKTFTYSNFIIYELDQSGNSGINLGPAGEWNPQSFACSASGAPDNVDFYFTDTSPGSSGLVQYLASPDQLPTAWEESDVGNNTTGWRENYIERKSPQDGIIEDITAKKYAAIPNGVYCFKVERGGEYYFGTLELGSVTNTQANIVKIRIQNIPGFRVIGR